MYCEFSNKKVTMIELFACKETRKIWNRQFSKKLPSEIQQQAFEKMRRLNRATVLTIFSFRRPTILNLSKVSGKVNLVSVSTNNGDCVLNLTAMSKIWNWLIITK